MLNNERAEILCLNRVKNICFYESSFETDGQILFRSDRSENVFHYGFEYNENISPLLCDYTEYDSLAKLILTAQFTDNLSNTTKFPDFVCENGLIEHFVVSTTKENKKGSEYLKELSIHEKKLDQKVNNDISNKEIIKFYSERFDKPQQNYELFKKSFERNWNKHVDSLLKYDGNKENVCFLIQCDSYGLRMSIRNNDDDKFLPNIKDGKLLKNTYPRAEKFNSIMLGRCKDLMKYMYEYRNEVKYVIFLSDDNIEIIKTDKADYIANILPEYYIYPTYTGETITDVRITMSNDFTNMEKLTNENK